MKLFFLLINLIQYIYHVRSLQCGQCIGGADWLTCPDPFNVQYELRLYDQNALEFACHKDLDLSFLDGCQFEEIGFVQFKFFSCDYPQNETFFNIFSQMGIDPNNLFGLSFLKWGNGSFPQESGNSMLEGLLNLTSLKLSDTNMTSLSPDMFSHTPKLKMLEINTNNLATLPEDIFLPLETLKNLTMNNNNLTVLPSEVFRNLSSLEHLRLMSNRIKSLHPDQFSGLSHLKWIYLRNNLLEWLPENLFADCDNLLLVDLSNNELETLPVNLFSKDAKLEKLYLQRNKISSISEDFLSELKSLIQLDVSSNALTSLSSSSFANNIQLKKLYLARNSLETLSKDIFSQNTELEVVDLERNRLVEIPSFSSSPQILEIYLQRNNISSISQQDFPSRNSKLKKLNLAHNDLNGDSILFYGLLSISNQLNLEEINLSSNKFRSNPLGFGFYNFNRLKRVDLSYNLIKNLNMFLDFTGLPENIEVSFKNNKIETIIVPSNWDDHTSQKFSVDLGGNPLSCDCGLHRLADLLKTSAISPKNIVIKNGADLKCQTPPNVANKTIMHLDLREFICKNITHCISKECPCNFQAHDSLMTVDCSSHNLATPPDILPKNPSLNYTLDLSGNRIDDFDFSNENYEYLNNISLRHNLIQENTLENVTSFPSRLSYLDIRNNKLRYLPEAFTQLLNDTQVSVWLESEHWLCNCELRHMLKYLQTNLDKVKDKERIRCADSGNSGNSGKLVIDLKLDDLCPFYQESGFIAAASIVIIIVLVASISATVLFFKHKRDIYVWLYSHKLFLFFVTQNELDEDKIYDAFVSFAQEDDPYVLELCQKLEDEDPRFKLCIHYRDWLAGEYIFNQVIKSIDDSRRIIVLLSKNFVQSEWGQAEFRQARQQTLNDLVHRLIVIVVDELPPESEMDPQLLEYIKSRTYLEWKNPRFWDQLRYAMPHNKRLDKKKHYIGSIDRIELKNGNSVQGVHV